MIRLRFALLPMLALALLVPALAPPATAAEPPAASDSAPSPASIPAAGAPEVQVYRQGDTELEGLLFRPASGGTPDAPLPAVILIHQWMGHGPYEAARAAGFAQAGYLAFVADIYGKGDRPKDRSEAPKYAGKYRGDRPLLRARARAVLDHVRALPGVDPARIAVVGYCFGGGTVLELARDGAGFAGGICVHGNLDTPQPAAQGGVKAPLLVQHGADDPHVPDTQVAAFLAEMRAAKADYVLEHYGGAVHSFSDPGAGDDPAKGAAYDAKADARSYARQLIFLKEVLGR